MLRARDVEPIQTALDKLKNRHNQQISLFHKLETLRDRLIAEGDEAIPTVLELYPDADRQQLRSLVRNAQKSRLRISRQNHSVRFSRIYVNWLKKTVIGRGRVTPAPDSILLAGVIYSQNSVFIKQCIHQTMHLSNNMLINDIKM